MRSRAAVVIIGGGVIGASVAYHLAERGLSDVLVIERGALGSGSTGRSAGGVRQQFSTEANCRLSILSVEKLLRFQDQTGWDPGFHQVGYLFLLTQREHWDLFQRTVDLQRRLGIPVGLLTPGEAQALAPPIVVDDVLGATFCPTDGHADPTQVCLGYASAARARGVEVASGVTVTSVEAAGGRVAAVDTDQGRVITPLVVRGRAVGGADRGHGGHRGPRATVSAPDLLHGKLPAGAGRGAHGGRLRIEHVLPTGGPRPAARHDRPQ